MNDIEEIIEALRQQLECQEMGTQEAREIEEELEYQLRDLDSIRYATRQFRSPGSVRSHER